MFTSLSRTIGNVFEFSLPMIIISVVVAITLRAADIYDLGSRLFLKNVLGNIIMFLPYGFFTSYFLKEKKLLPIFILTVVTSLTIECTQLMIGRVFDIDDILLNIIGGVLGHYLYILILKIGDMCPRVLQREWFLNLVSIILLVGLITLL